jgi:hypothetical protein
MTSAPIDLLDRQHDRLQSKDGAEFIHELRRFHQFLTTGPEAVVTALAGLRADAEQMERDFKDHDAALVPALVELKSKLVDRAPTADDSGEPRPQEQRGPAGLTWSFGLANFEQVATNGPDRIIVRQGFDDSRSGMLLRILEQKLRALQWTQDADTPNPRPSETNLRPDLDDLARDLRNLAEQHRYAKQTFTNAVETHGGFQVLHLDITVNEMNPEPRQVETDEDEHAWMDETFKRVLGGWHVIEDAAAGRTLDSTHEQMLRHHITRLKPAAERVYEDIRLKLATAPPAAPLPAPRRGYGERVLRWLRSPEYALLGGACIGPAIAQLVTGESNGFWVFVALALVFLLVPPALTRPPTMTYTRISVAFIVAGSGVVVAALLLGGLGVALVAFALVALAFLAGRRSRG